MQTVTKDPIDLFCDITSIRRPDISQGNGITSEELDKWAKPLKHMLGLVGGSEYHFRRALVAAVNSTNITIATPASIEPEYIKTVNRLNGQKAPPEPTPADYEAYRAHVLTIAPHALY